VSQNQLGTRKAVENTTENNAQRVRGGFDCPTPGRAM
jgi:hypothetical protein